MKLIGMPYGDNLFCYAEWRMPVKVEWRQQEKTVFVRTTVQFFRQNKRNAGKVMEQEFDKQESLPDMRWDVMRALQDDLVGIHLKNRQHVWDE